MSDLAVPLAAPGTYPVPEGRGRWRFTLHNRVFSTAAVLPSTTGIGEIVDARSRQLTQAWDSAAQLVLTVDGHSQSALAIQEMANDVVAWRWDDQQGADVAMFRGPITQSEDDLDEQSHTVTFTCHDHLALLTRRYYTGATPLTYTNIDQDIMVPQLLAQATSSLQSGSGAAFSPGSTLPMLVQLVNPDGTGRTSNSGQQRTRSYLGGQQFGAAIDDLAKVINGFDYDVSPCSPGNGYDLLRVWYPNQGVTRSDMALVYGSNVATVKRAVDSGSYANYDRVLGNNGNSDQTAAQLYAEYWNSDANNVTVVPYGIWMNADNAADINVQATLTQEAQGNVGLTDPLIPTYTLGLRPGSYEYGYPNMGDTVPLIIQSGRLNVNTTIRVIGITYAIGDDGDEAVTLTVGRPAVTLGQILAESQLDIHALSRR